MRGAVERFRAIQNIVQSEDRASRTVALVLLDEFARLRTSPGRFRQQLLERLQVRAACVDLHVAGDPGFHGDSVERGRNCPRPAGSRRTRCRPEQPPAVLGPARVPARLWTAKRGVAQWARQAIP